MLVKTRKDFNKMVKAVKACKTVYVDTETTGLKPFAGDRICGVGIATSPEDSWYLPFRHSGEHYTKGNLPMKWLIELAQLLGTVPNIAGYNLKFDLEMLARDGYISEEGQRLVDVLVMARLVCPEKYPPGGMGLASMTNRFVGAGEGEYDTNLKEWMRKAKLWVDKPAAGGPKIRKFHEVPIDRLGPYCESDTVYALKLKHIFQRLILETGQGKVWRGEVNVTKVFYEMEERGVAVDVIYCRAAITKVEKRLEEIQTQIYELAGGKFNLNAPAQVVEALSNISVHSPIKTSPSKRFPKGQESWGKEALSILGDKAHPIIALLREFKCWSSLKNTYLVVFRDSKGVLHCTFKPWGTITGRISCAEPNLQNLPKSARGVIEESDAAEKHFGFLVELLGETVAEQLDTGVDVTYNPEEWDEDDERMVAARRAIVPRPGYELIAADYSQMEMLVFLCYCNNKKLLKVIEDSYLAGEPFDFHAIVATEVWGGPDHPNFKTFRSWAKAINFGLIFGIGKVKLAASLKVDTEEAEEYKNTYFKRIEGSREFIKRAMGVAKETGTVKNFFGRRYEIEPGREYVAVNYLIQGSCADFMKDRMWKIRQAISHLDAHIVLQVHDEVVLEVRIAQVMEAARIVKTVMEEKIFQIVLPVEVSRCKESWVEKEKIALE